jgi:hypothetical protein
MNHRTGIFEKSSPCIGGGEWKAMTGKDDRITRRAVVDAAPASPFLKECRV